MDNIKKMDELNDFLPDKRISDLLHRTAHRAKAIHIDDTFDFINISDVHQTPNNEMAQEEAVYHSAILGHLIGTQFIGMSGDVINGDASRGSTKEAALTSLQRTIYNIRSQTCVPVLAAKGNHDDNLWDGQFGQDEYGVLPIAWHHYMIKPFEKHFTFDLNNKFGNYFYSDFKEHKMRVIVLNSVDVPYEKQQDGKPKYWGMWKYVFQNQQINWLAHEALNVNRVGVSL